MALVRDPVIIKNGESARILPLGFYEPGTYTVPIQPNGNSLLSSILVLSVEPGASVRVNYFQTTSADEASERTEIVSHDNISTASPQARQLLVTRIHSKVFAEVIVTGGEVQVGILGSVVSTFATDLEAALKADAQALAPTGSDRGMPIMVVDRANDQFRFLAADPDGNLAVSGSFSLQGINKPLRGFRALAPAEEFDLIDYTVPVGSSLTVLSGKDSALGDVTFEIFVDGESYLRAFTSFFERTIPIDFVSPLRLSGGQRIIVRVTSRTTFGTTNEANAFIYAYEVGNS